LAKGKEASRVVCMTPPEKKSTTESLAFYTQTLEGGNYSPQSNKTRMEKQKEVFNSPMLARI
jgi:hypothetical protein